VISVNRVVGTFEDILDETIIDIPNGEKVVFSVDSASLMISINDNLHYMEYRAVDGIVEFCNDSSDYFAIDKLYVKSKFPNSPGRIRVWVKI